MHKRRNRPSEAFSQLTFSCWSCGSFWIKHIWLVFNVDVHITEIPMSFGIVDIV